MTDSQHHERTAAIHGTADLHARPPYDIVRITIRSEQPGPFRVGLAQPLVDDIPYSRIEFISEYYGDSWTFRDEQIEFVHELDGASPLVTAFAAKNVDRASLEAMVRQLTVEVRDDDGTPVASLSGDSLLADDDGETDGAALDADTDRRTVEPTAGADGEQPVQGPLAEARRVSDDLHDELEPPAGSSSGSTDSTSGDDAWESPDRTTGTERTDGDSEDAEGDDAAGNDGLPANVADYVLEDVCEEIESAAEFEWEPVDPSGVTASGGVLDRVLSWFR